MHTIATIGRVTILLWIAVPLAACQTSVSAAMITSSVTAELTAENAGGIAGDLVGRLTEQVGPGATTIGLHDDGSVFGEALEASLRETGYAVVTDLKTPPAGTVSLAYSIDGFEGSVLARVSTPSLELTRVYRVDAEGVTPISPLSIMQRGPDRGP